MTRIRVEKSDPPESKVVLADAVVRISTALDELLDGGLNEDAIAVLLRHKTGVGLTQIHTIFDGLRQLRGWYCR